MLVLSRKKGEWLAVSGGIGVCVVDVRGDKVRLGITAPSDVRVMRPEILDDGELASLGAPAFHSPEYMI